MAELSYPTSGGGSVTDANYESLIGEAVPSGLIGTVASESLVYADATGRQVKVRASRAAIVRGFRWQSDGAGIVRAIDANTSGQPRIDLAVLRLNRSDWTVTFQIVKGTPAATPAAPAVTQQAGPTGVWELPLANILVANAATTLAASTVTNRSQYIGGWAYEGDKSQPPMTSLNPQFFYAGDYARQYAMVGAGWQVIGEAGSLTQVTVLDAWGGAAGGDSRVYCKRWNGFVFLQGLLYRTGGDLAADTTTNLFTLPAAYRPLNNFYWVGYAGGTAMNGYVDSSTGVVSLVNYTVPFKKGAFLAIHPLVYPANNS